MAYLFSFSAFPHRAVGWLIRLLSATLFLAQPALSQTVRYVRTDGTNTNPTSATSWATATSDLQAAINASNAGDQVWVKFGTYKPGGNANTDRTLSFNLKNGVAVYGSFFGSETTLAQRGVPVTYSILSGEIGNTSTTSDNAYHVVSAIANPGLTLSNSTLLDGFRIEKGNANGSSTGTFDSGGGMVIAGYGTAAPTLRYCVFDGNQATSKGGGLLSVGIKISSSTGLAAPILTNCSFSNNTATTGGGIHSTESGGGDNTLSLQNSQFTFNAAGNGGGLYADAGSSYQITSTEFRGNRASDLGGGMYLTNLPGSPTSAGLVQNCLFRINTANKGGAVWHNNVGADATVGASYRNCTFRENTATLDAGAVYNFQSTITFFNCGFTGNTANVNAGAIYSFGPSVAPQESIQTFYNCSFANNEAAGTASNTGAGVLVSVGRNPMYLYNSILFGNGNAAKNFYSELSSQIRITNSLLEAGVANFAFNPEFGIIQLTNISPFADVTTLAITPCQPAVNGALNVSSSTNSIGTTDLLGNARFVGSSADLGAVEYQGTTLSTVLGFVSQPASQSLNACVGANVTGVVSVTGGPPTYQWYRNGLPVGGATSATLTLPNVQTANAGTYVAVVTGGCNSLTSNSLTLVVSEPVWIDPQTVATTTLCSGLLVTLTPSVTGTVSNYQWYRNGASIPGATSATFVISNTQPANSGSYVLVAVGPCNSFTSAPYNLTVVLSAVIVRQPSSGSVVCVGTTVTVSVSTSGLVRGYQWFRNGLLINGATSATLTLPNVQTAEAGQYWVRVTDNCTSVTSTAFSLSVNTPVQIEPQTPINFTTCAKASNYTSYTLTFSVTGTVSSLQWYRDGVPISGATSTSLVVLDNQSANSGSYVLVAIGPCTSVTSVAINLVFLPAARLYVNANASGANDGSSWANAYRSLQSALTNFPTAECIGVDIWVAKGVYKPSTTDRAASFVVRQGVAVYGGFAGTETTLGQQNLALNPTILSGDIDNNDTNTDGNSIAESYTAIQGNNSYHVVKGNGGAFRLDGLIITAGLANHPIGTIDGEEDRSGGAIYTSGSNYSLVNCRIQGNSAENYGGGLYTVSDSPRLTNCSFSGNRAALGGGALMRFGNPLLTNCSFGGNSANNGGAILCDGSMQLLNSIVWGNTASANAGISSAGYTATYSDIQSLTTGTGNIQADPLFVNVADGNLALRSNSPAINLGNPATTTAQAGATDVISNPRIVNTRIDMGAYEFQGTAVPIYTLKTGSWTDPTVWSVGYVPGSGDVVELRHVVTIPAGYLASSLRMVFAVGGRLSYGAGGRLQLGQ